MRNKVIHTFPLNYHLSYCYIGVMQEFDEYSLPQTKAISFDLSRFSVEKQTEHEFAHYVNLTAKLIKRPYFQTFKLVEQWPLELIIRRYNDCTKHAGTMPGDVKWWYLRKKNMVK